MKRLITKPEQFQMIRNGIQTKKDHIGNHWPVVKLFMPDGAAIWLLSELDPMDPDVAFGLCDLGLGFPELGYVRISEIKSLRGVLGLSVERDLGFKATKSVLEYSSDAHDARRITV